jgi:hypothetical protein
MVRDATRAKRDTQWSLNHSIFLPRASPDHP